jgi:uncharacterized protein
LNRGTGYLTWLRSKDSVITNLLEQQAELAARATATLLELSMTVSTNLEESKRHQSQIRDLEREGNQLVRKLLNIVDETFVTPLDREDISRISKAIEKILNNTQRVADNIILFNIGKLSSGMLELVTVLKDVSKKVSESISRIKKLKKASVIFEQGTSISKYEDQADAIYKQAISALFRANDAIEILRSKEIYDFLRRAITRCVDLSELLEDMALKYA